MKTSDLLKISKNELYGKIVSFPTDTVNGVGALIDDIEGINKIYNLKHRNPNKPIAVLAPNVESILPYIEVPSIEIENIMKKYWPGALTIIFKKNKEINLEITKNLDTIAFRIPNSKIALEILNHFGPMATTSVNLSGSEPLNSYQLIYDNFHDQIDYLIEEEESKSGISSTIVDATTYPYKVIRQGDIKL